MYDLQQGVCRQVELEGAHSDALEHKAAHMQTLREGVCPEVVLVQARGVVVHEVSTSEEFVE